MAEYHEDEVLRQLNEEEDVHEYYTLLNVSNNADQDEIRRAYHRLCKFYHPDKYLDEEKQKIATKFFRRIQEAYKVLSDPRTRAIYDKKGKAGLENDMAIVERTSLPTELLEEYEKLKELWEDRTYIQDSEPHGSFTMALDATPLVDGYYGQGGISLEKFEIQQSVNAPVTKSAFGNVTGIVSMKKHSQMYGGIQFALRQLLSNQNWVKVSALMGSRPALGVEGYHVISDKMWVSGQSSLMIAGPSVFGFTASGNITRRFNETTSGSIIVGEMGQTASVKLSHRLSPTTGLEGEVTVSEQSSHIKGIIRHQPLSQYMFKTGLQVGTNGVNVFYGVEHEVAKLTTIGFTVLVGPRGGVALKLKLMRTAMNFQVRVKLSDYVGASAIFYATAIPLVLYGCVKGLALAPILRKERLEEIKEKKSERTKDMMEKKKFAEAAIELMQETMERILNTEQAKHGLLILEAWYGKLIDNQPGDGLHHPKVIDVRIPLQCMVVDSKLILRESSKVSIPGFYDPCIGEKKFLKVIYEFRGMPHEVTVENSEPLIIPRVSHKVVNMVD